MKRDKRGGSTQPSPERRLVLWPNLEATGPYVLRQNVSGSLTYYDHYVAGHS